MNNHYDLNETRNIFLAAYLLGDGFQVVSNRVVDHRVLFAFHDTPELRQAHDEFYQGKAKVEPISWQNKIRDLRIEVQRLVSQNALDPNF